MVKEMTDGTGAFLQLYCRAKNFEKYYYVSCKYLKFGSKLAVSVLHSCNQY